MAMHRLLGALLVGHLAAVSSATAQTCPTGSGQDLSQTQIGQLLSGRYAIGTQYDSQYFNLLHSGATGGAVTDYKRGPSHPVDKSTVVGSWSIGEAVGRDVVTYTYGTRTYSYSITDKPTGQNRPGPGTYTFCQRAGSAPNNVGSALTVTVSNIPGAVQP